MDKELKKDIKILLFLDDLLSPAGKVTGILDDVEDELEDMFGKPGKRQFKIEDLFKWDKEEKE